MGIKHKYKLDQVVMVDCAAYQGRGKVLAVIQDCCEPHDAPCYGIEIGGAHYTICEEQLKPCN